MVMPSEKQPQQAQRVFHQDPDDATRDERGDRGNRGQQHRAGAGQVHVESVGRHGRRERRIPANGGCTPASAARRQPEPGRAAA